MIDYLIGRLPLAAVFIVAWKLRAKAGVRDVGWVWEKRAWREVWR